MKQEINPAVMVGVIIVVVALLGFFLFKSVAPHPTAVTPSPVAAEGEGAAVKRANHQRLQGGQPSATTPAAPPSASDRM